MSTEPEMRTGSCISYCFRLQDGEHHPLCNLYRLDISMLEPLGDGEIDDILRHNCGSTRHCDHGQFGPFPKGCNEIDLMRAIVTIRGLKETNSKLNRRATKAEGIVLQKVRDGGPSLGRALANAACGPLRRENAELRARIAEKGGAA